MQSLTVEELAARYEAVLASTLDPVITIDAHGTILSASNSIDRVFGWKPEELIGKNVSMLMTDPHRELHDTYLARFRQTGEATILGRVREFQAIRKDGSVFPIELAVARVEMPDTSDGESLFTGIIRDVTVRKRTESELSRYRKHLEALVEDRTSELRDSHERLRMADRLASIGTLAAGLGHDMDNVLFPTRCRLDSIEASKDLSESVRHEIVEIRSSVQYLQRLTDGLRLFALDPEDASAMQGITEIHSWWDQVQPLLAKTIPNNAKLTTEIAKDLPPVSIAPHQLTQAILNLIVNSGEAIDEHQSDGAVKLFAETFDDQRFVRVGVSDNGCGMTDEVRKHALEPFFTRKTRELSTGLGLSMVHGVTKSVGGSVEIESQPGLGTSITMTLPALERTGFSASNDQDPAETKTAAVSIQNPRISAYTSALLESLGLATSSVDKGMPTASHIWVAELNQVTVPSMELFLKEAPGRRIVLFCPPEQSAALQNVPVINEIGIATNLDEIRSMVRTIAHEAPGARR